MNVLITNANNTSDLRPPFPYDTWLEYWESKKGKLKVNVIYRCPTDCGNRGLRSDFDGCHVQKVNDPSGKMYIIPLCSACNHRKDVFGVNDDLLEPAP